MKSRLLFPHFFRYIGYLLAFPGLVLGFLTQFKHYEIAGFGFSFRHAGEHQISFENYTNELALMMIVLGLLFMAFAKVKREDELTSKMRLYALHWAILLNYSLYAFVIILVFFCSTFNIRIAPYNMFGPFIYVMNFSTYNLFTPILIFVIIFYFQLYRSKSEFVVKPIQCLSYKFNPWGKWLSIAMLLPYIAGNYMYMSFLALPAFFFPFMVVLWMYSREKSEDEYIGTLRLEAMQVAVYTHYFIVLLSNFLFYGGTFWQLEYDYMITIPVIFIIWFQYRLYRLRSSETKSPIILSL